jgi:hypothetical protein
MKRCPTCNNALPLSGRCDFCRRVAAALADAPGDEPPLPLAEEADEFNDWRTADASPETGAALKREFPPPATELPDPLPRPLDDPLRTLGWFTLAVFVLTVAVGLATVATEEPAADGPPWWVRHGGWIAGAWFALAVWRLLPSRRTGVLYLRSFRHDDNTADIRTDLVRAFGPRVRVSGIRDPRRRALRWLRHLNQLVFALRYATPKYMNLEAGDDWKARLWRSMTQARGAVLDATDLTTYVQDEVRMCYRTFGPGRVLFVGDSRMSAAEWRARIAAVLELPAGAPIRVALWSIDREWRRAFRAEAAAFARQLPQRPPALSPAGSEIAYQGVSLDHPPAPTRWPVSEVIVGSVVAAGVTTALSVLMRVNTPFLIATLAAAVWLGVTQTRAFFGYLAECGTAREWLLTVLTAGVGLLGLFAAGVAPGVWKVRTAAAQMSASNGLKQIGVAMHNRHDAEGGLPPPAVYDRGGKPLLSWRVAILPYIEQGGELYKEFKLDEPWDSPHNLPLVGRMPAVYRHPLSDAPPGHTHFRVFVTPNGAKGPAAVFRPAARGPSMALISDGPWNTVLVVEARDAVPWTKPDELDYAADKPLPKVGGHFPGAFLVLMADGSVRRLPTDLPEPTLRALVTANGDERINAP